MPEGAGGCGDKTRGGVVLPGHDQKLRAALEKAVGGLLAMRVWLKKRRVCRSDVLRKPKANE
jgi:hypothetical protein